MELTLPVLITQILFSGRTSTLGTAYVTNLTLEYSPPGNKTVLNYYTTETGSTKVSHSTINISLTIPYDIYVATFIIIQYFAAPHLNTLVQLEQPLQTERIRLRPVEWVDSYQSFSLEYICLGVGLFGCLATEGTIILSDTGIPMNYTYSL